MLTLARKALALVVWIDAQQLVCDADGRMEPLPYDMRFQTDTQPQAGVIEAGASASDEAGASRGRGQDPSARSNKRAIAWLTCAGTCGQYFRGRSGRVVSEVGLCGISASVKLLRMDRSRRKVGWLFRQVISRLARRHWVFPGYGGDR